MEGKGGEGLKGRSFCSYGAACVTTKNVMDFLTWKLSETHAIGIFMETLSYRYDISLSLYLTPPPTLLR